MGDLLRALKEEMVTRRDYITPPDTLYVGGGTPSLVPAKELGGLIEFAKELWKTDFVEVTVELNPEDVTTDYGKELIDVGVNRASVGIQSFCDNHLQFMNRRHSALQAIHAVEALQSVGFQNISLDLMFGFPGLLETEWRRNIQQALALHPKHISAYQLGIEPGTPIYKEVNKGTIEMVEEDVAAGHYTLLQEMLATADFEQYEISNFAQKGYRSRHNSKYWLGVPYLGVGPAAHSYNGVARHANVKSVQRYLDGINFGLPYIKKESITTKKRYNEFVMTRLRTAEGLCQKTFDEEFTDKKIRLYYEQSLHDLLQKGLLVMEAGYVKILPQKWFIVDGIIRELVVS
jgi:oxygen-independent coproporphyrinogen-3 oxidase